MKVAEALKSVLESEGASHYSIAKRLGVSTVTITHMWQQKSIGSSRLVRICDLVGWDVVLVKRGSKLPKGSIVLEEAE